MARFTAAQRQAGAEISADASRSHDRDSHLPLAIATHRISRWLWYQQCPKQRTKQRMKREVHVKTRVLRSG